MARMTIDEVRSARQTCYDRLKKAGYDPTLQITSRKEFVKVVQDVFEGIPREERKAIGLHVYDGTGGMFVGLLERIKDDGLRNEIIREVNQDDPDPNRRRGTNRYPGKLTAGDVSLRVLRSGCTTADIAELARVKDGNTKYNDPAGMPDFMKSAAARGLFVGSRHLKA